MHGIAYSWDRDVASHVLPLGSARPSPPYDMGMQCLWYSYAVHHEGTGVLTTELPHVVKFLVTRMKLIATKHVSGLTTLFGDVCSRDDIRILTQEDFIALFPARRASSQHELLHRNCVSLSPELTQFDPQPCDPYTQGN